MFVAETAVIPRKTQHIHTNKYLIANSLSLIEEAENNRTTPWCFYLSILTQYEEIPRDQPNYILRYTGKPP